MTIHRILNLIELSGITAKTLIQETGLSQSAISEWKKGKAKPSADALVKISEYFETPIEYLLGMGVFSNWDELQTATALDAIIAAVYRDFDLDMYFTTGNSVISEFRSAVYGNEIDMIRFFNWAVDSVKLEQIPNNESVETKAYLKYSNVLQAMLSREPQKPQTRVFTTKDLFDNFTERMTVESYSSLSEDEKRLLDGYRRLTDIQKGEIFKVINSFRYNWDKPFA